LATSSGLTMTAEMKAEPAAEKARSGMVNCASELEFVCDIPNSNSNLSYVCMNNNLIAELKMEKERCIISYVYIYYIRGVKLSAAPNIVEYPRLHSRFLFPFTNKKLFDFFFKE
jgi:hypothetical protein